MITGTAARALPQGSTNEGCRKCWAIQSLMAVRSASSRATLTWSRRVHADAMVQVMGQRGVQVLAGADRLVIDQLAGTVAGGSFPGIHSGPPGNRRGGPAGRRRGRRASSSPSNFVVPGVIEIELFVVQDVKDHHVVPAVPQQAQARVQRLAGSTNRSEITTIIPRSDCSSATCASNAVEVRLAGRAFAVCRASMIACRWLCRLRGGTRDADRVVERRQADRVLLPQQQVRQAAATVQA